MAIKCNSCGTVFETNSIPVKCNECGNTDMGMFERVASKVDPERHEKERKLLESLGRS